MEDYYQVLGVLSNASPEEIKERFRFLAHAYHPDKFATSTHKKHAEEAFKKINEAYQILSNPERRSEYDRQRSSSGSKYEEERRRREEAEAARRYAEEEYRKREEAEAAQRHAEEEQRKREEAEAAQRRAEEEQQRRDQAKVERRRTKTELVKRLWRGEVSLARTYWVFGVIAGMLFNAANTAIEYNYIRLVNTAYGQLLIYLLLAAQLIYFAFINVAIWRSANKYKGPARWAVLAKIAVIFGTLALIGSAGKMHESSTKITNSDLTEMALLLNKSLPVMVNNVTQLYSISAEKQQLTYHYQIVNKGASEVDQAIFYNRVHSQIVTRVCVAEDMKRFFQNGVTVIYRYVGSDNSLIADIIVTPSDCGY